MIDTIGGEEASVLTIVVSDGVSQVLRAEHCTAASAGVDLAQVSVGVLLYVRFITRIVVGSLELEPVPQTMQLLIQEKYESRRHFSQAP